MRLIGWFFVACVGVALLKLAVAALAIALCILLLWFAVNRPREAVVILAILGLVSMTERHPLVCIGLVTIVLTVCLLEKVLCNACRK